MCVCMVSKSENTICGSYTQTLTRWQWERDRLWFLVYAAFSELNLTHSVVCLLFIRNTFWVFVCAFTMHNHHHHHHHRYFQHHQQQTFIHVVSLRSDLWVSHLDSSSIRDYTADRVNVCWCVASAKQRALFPVECEISKKYDIPVVRQSYVPLSLSLTNGLYANWNSIKVYWQHA